MSVTVSATPWSRQAWPPQPACWAANSRTCWLIHVPEHGFFHGGFQFGRRMGSVFVFQDAQMGLAAASDLVTGDTRFARFSISLSVPVDQAGK